MDNAKTVAQKRKPPQNPIIGKTRADKWDTQIDGLIVDLDINTAATERTRSRVKAVAQASMIRDIVAIILLLVVIGLLVWRGILTDQRLVGCSNGAVVSESRGGR